MVDDYGCWFISLSFLTSYSLERQWLIFISLILPMISWGFFCISASTLEQFSA